MTIKADEKSVYGKKVHDDLIFAPTTKEGDADYILIAGKRGRSDSQDYAGYPRHPLPGACAARTSNEYRGDAG